MTWLLLLSLLDSGHVTQIRLDNTTEVQCLQLGHRIADLFDRDSPADHHLVVECMPDRLGNPQVPAEFQK